MRCKAWIVATIMMSSVLTTGCTTSGPLPAAAAGSVAATTAYRIGAGDKFRLNVFNEPALSGQEYSVNTEGEASLPLIGLVKVDGMTPREAEAEITKRYAAGYINNPRVNIDISQYRPFYILGEVKQPGQYPFATGLTVLSAVAIAQGYTYRADQKRVFVRHGDKSSEESVPLAADTPVLPGDTIRIPERFF